jgi:hypothetical protein
MNLSVRKRGVAIIAASVATAALLGGPTVSLALDVGQSLTATPSSGTTAAPAAPSTTTKTTPLPRVVNRSSTESQPAPVSATVQGSNPHGQATVLSVSLAGQEAVVVGRSRGEQQSDGTYHGHTTTIGLFGHDVIANDTTSGQTAKGPLAPLQEQVLDQVCKGSSGNVCVDLLRADSATTATGSTNHSRLAGLVLGGNNGVVATAGDSNGNIQSNGDCQTAHGDVTLLKLMLGGNPLIDIGESASDSNACPSGTTVTDSTNPLVAIGGQQIPLPGCGSNSPGNLIDAGPLLTIACNARSGAGVGGTVQDALAGTVISSGNTPVGAVSGAGTGASAQPAAGQAVAGVRQTGSSGTTGARTNAGTDNSGSGGGSKGNGSNGNNSNGSNAPASARQTKPLTAAAGDKLPYTGTNVVIALFIASCLLTAGLGLRNRMRPGMGE